MSDWADKSSDDLPTRIASGLVLIGVGLGAAWAGGPWFAAAAGAAAAAMSFEWARMSERASLHAGFAVVWVASLAAVMAASWGRIEVSFAALSAGAALAALRRPAGKRWAAAFGVFYVGGPCAAFVWLRQLDGGLAIVLSLFAVIWSADTFAYFGGRFIGGPRLAPSLSPNKTWAGLAAGAAAGAGAGVALAAAFGAAPLPWACAGFVIAAVGLGGDLFESLLKRRYGVKDASNLIPGHGGVMDRLDGLMAATTLVALVRGLLPGPFEQLFGAAA